MEKEKEREKKGMIFICWIPIDKDPRKQFLYPGLTPESSIPDFVMEALLAKEELPETGKKYIQEKIKENSYYLSNPTKKYCVTAIYCEYKENEKGEAIPTFDTEEIKKIDKQFKDLRKIFYKE